MFPDKITKTKPKVAMHYYYDKTTNRCVSKQIMKSP